MSIKYNGGYIPAVGADGTTLVANSASATGVAWAGPTFAAGKNKIINGDFGIWQRGTTFNAVANNAYNADRWFINYDGTATWNITQQAFTAGTAPVAGYESPYYFQAAMSANTSSTYFDAVQRIEDVRTFAGQTVTMSFWAKADSARTSLVYLIQNFGSGGSGSVIAPTSSITYSNSWNRYTFTIAVPSVAGKTIGTGGNLQLGIRTTATTGSSLQIWGVQLEAGSVATPFSTATGTIQGELTACQRYYQRYTVGASYGYFPMTGFATSTTVITEQTIAPVVMRVSPNSIEYGGAFQTLGGGNLIVGTITNACDTGNLLRVTCAVTGAVSGLFYQISSNNNINSYLAWSAEL